MLGLVQWGSCGENSGSRMWKFYYLLVLLFTWAHLPASLGLSLLTCRPRLHQAILQTFLGLAFLLHSSALTLDPAEHYWVRSSHCGLSGGDSCTSLGFQGGIMGKEPPTSAGDRRDSDLVPGLGRSPGGGRATHSHTLAWRIPWTVEPGGPRFLGSQRVGHNWSNLAWKHTWPFISRDRQNFRLKMVWKY